MVNVQRAPEPTNRCDPCHPSFLGLCRFRPAPRLTIGRQRPTMDEVVPNHRTNFRPIYVMVRGLEISADVFVLVPGLTLPQRMGRVQTAGSPVGATDPFVPPLRG